MSSRFKLILVMLVPVAVVAASVIWFISMGGGQGRDSADRVHAADPDELNRRMEAVASDLQSPDLFTLDDGAIYVRRNRERLRAYTVTDRVAGVIRETHREGAPWGPNMAGVLPPGTKVYRVINEPDLLAVKTGSEPGAESIFYTKTAFDPQPAD